MALFWSSMKTSFLMLVLLTSVVKSDGIETTVSGGAEPVNDNNVIGDTTTYTSFDQTPLDFISESGDTSIDTTTEYVVDTTSTPDTVHTTPSRTSTAVYVSHTTSTHNVSTTIATPLTSTQNTSLDELYLRQERDKLKQEADSLRVAVIFLGVLLAVAIIVIIVIIAWIVMKKFRSRKKMNKQNADSLRDLSKDEEFLSNTHYNDTSNPHKIKKQHTKTVSDTHTGMNAGDNHDIFTQHGINTHNEETMEGLYENNPNCQTFVPQTTAAHSKPNKHHVDPLYLNYETEATPTNTETNIDEVYATTDEVADNDTELVYEQVEDETAKENPESRNNVPLKTRVYTKTPEDNNCQNADPEHVYANYSNTGGGEK